MLRVVNQTILYSLILAIIKFMEMVETTVLLVGMEMNTFLAVMGMMFYWAEPEMTTSREATEMIPYGEV